MKKKILITGGCGYIGSSLGNYFSDKYEVITLDKRKKNIFLNKKIKHYICNLLDKNKCSTIERMKKRSKATTSSRWSLLNR